MTDCRHDQILRLSAKCSDSVFLRFPDGTEYEGYIPSPNFGLGSGDYVGIKVCLDCHKVIGFDNEAYEQARANIEEELRRT